MIVPMIKYDFVLHSKELPAFLEKLQALGIVDTKRSSKPIDERSSTLFEEINRYNSALKQLKKIKIEKTEPVDDTVTAQYIVQRTEQLVEDKELTLLRKSKVLAEISAARPWKRWSKESLDRLGELKIIPHFYIVPEKKYNKEWEQEFPMLNLNQENGRIYLVVLEQIGSSYHFPLQETKLPSASIELLEEELTQIEHHLDLIQQEFEKLTLSIDLITNYRLELISQLDLYLAGKGSTLAAEDTLSIVTAFVPKPQQSSFEEFTTQELQIYVSEEATIEDDPPIKLKNNWYARLFEPIGDMFIPPVYNELDVTPYFAPFYMIFFGFCLGDMGYGLVLILAGIIAKRYMPKMKSIFSLMQFLGLGCLIIPSLSGSFFGLKIGEVFKIDGFFLDDLQMFWLAIALGGFQIIVGKLIQAFDWMKRKGIQYGLAPLGWALLMIGVALLVGIKILLLPIPSFILPVTLYSGGLLIIFFTSDAKNILVRVLKSLACIMDIPGLFGDLLSYIRLFGLGAAGGILGFVVNKVGSMIWDIPYAGYFLGGFVFLIGHIAVLALSSLGALIHPMRLTFVEFYKNVGFTGGGRLYRPLKKNE